MRSQGLGRLMKRVLFYFTYCQAQDSRCVLAAICSPPSSTLNLRGNSCYFATDSSIALSLGTLTSTQSTHEISMSSFSSTTASPTATSSAMPSPTATTSRWNAATGNKIAIGIGVGCGVLFLMACIGIARFILRRRQDRRARATASANATR